jgi:SAM-dependent MidA family methyltransferase
VDLTAGLRRDASFDPDAIGSDPVLVERLRAEIESGGPVTFARFMHVALYDPERGYYTGTDPDREGLPARSAPPTRGGDFLTAPELHPVFGRLVGRQLTEVWERLSRPSPFVVREYGAGSGTLGLTIIAGLRADGSRLADELGYAPVELSAPRLAELRARYAEAGLADRLTEPDGRYVGAVLANEFLDALPVHRVAWMDGALRELFVGWDGEGFVAVPGEPSSEGLAGRLAAEGVTLAEGQVAEICLGVDPWVAGVAADLVDGAALVIDYGHEASSLYAASRRGGTLRAYIGQRVHDDPFRHVGRQDLTAHIDLTWLERSARSSGLEVLGRTTQAEFVTALGLGDLLAESAGRDLATGPTALTDHLELRSAAGRLLDPRALGGFHVVALGRGLTSEPPLRGFAWRLARGTATHE